MHLLSKSSLFALALCGIACTAQGPLTPEQAFDQLKAAYANSDAGSIEKMLSARSVEKIRTMLAMIGQMKASQRQALAEHFDIEIEALAELTVQKYIALQLAIGKKVGEDMVREAFRHRMIGKTVRGDTATVRVENGIELAFVREGPYWRLDLAEY